LHGDLSPNNFVIHEGIGYFIDFDHAEGETFTNNSNNSNNSNSITQLELIEHNPGDDLESLFYIFFEFVLKYGGAHGVVAPTWGKTTMPWADAYENLGATSGLCATFLAKKGAMSESDIMMDRVSDYFSEFKPIVDEWRL
ncbi:hypothetical protein P692DRAFT_20727334, partial [Suillus brevipes Sb2]